MSTFIRHEACPRCREDGRDRSGNNLARYANGSAYCFSCKYYEQGRQALPLNLEKLEEKSPPPNDLVPDLPSPNRNWLRSFGLTDEEIGRNFSWSPSYQRHVFSCRVRPLVVSAHDDDGWFYEGRSLNPNYVKSMQWGHKPYTLLGSWGQDGVVVIVEDIVSALKVKRTHGVIPLFGSSIPNDILVALCKMVTVKFVLWWLDADKFDKAKELMVKTRILRKQSAVIHTTEDPKYFNSHFINHEIKNAMDFCLEA